MGKRLPSCICSLKSSRPLLLLRTTCMSSCKHERSPTVVWSWSTTRKSSRAHKGHWSLRKVCVYSNSCEIWNGIGPQSAIDTSRPYARVYTSSKTWRVYDPYDRRRWQYQRPNYANPPHVVSHVDLMAASFVAIIDTKGRSLGSAIPNMESE